MLPKITKHRAVSFRDNEEKAPITQNQYDCDHCVCSQNQNNERLQIAREREHRYIAAEQEDKVQKTIAKSPLKSCTLTCTLAR